MNKSPEKNLEKITRIVNRRSPGLPISSRTLSISALVADALDGLGFLRLAHTLRSKSQSGEAWNYDDKIAWVKKMIRLDFRLREVVQREVSLQEKYRNLGDQLSPEIETGNKRQLIRVYAELQTLDREYWAVVRKIYRNEMDIPRTANKKSYVSLRKRSQWYLSNWLCNDCADRGGCCSRVCGCCRKSRNPDRPEGQGHCTKECGCCRRYRGFELNPEEQKLYEPVLDLPRDGLSPYVRNTYLAYVWGQW